mmetsp:Transcript_10631/g.31392  ORF Transcript_10631/g.31392 Transcript_10631/m.31392 type:complete len:694 (-) Transcript_10631:38-2119(-)
MLERAQGRAPAVRSLERLARRELLGGDGVLLGQRVVLVVHGVAQPLAAVLIEDFAALLVLLLGAAQGLRARVVADLLVVPEPRGAVRLELLGLGLIALGVLLGRDREGLRLLVLAALEVVLVPLDAAHLLVCVFLLVARLDLLVRQRVLLRLVVLAFLLQLRHVRLPHRLERGVHLALLLRRDAHADGPLVLGRLDVIGLPLRPRLLLGPSLGGLALRDFRRGDGAVLCLLVLLRLEVVDAPLAAAHLGVRSLGRGHLRRLGLVDGVLLGALVVGSLDRVLEPRLAVLLLLCGDGLVLCRLDAALLRLPVVALLGVVREPLLAVRLALVDASLLALLLLLVRDGVLEGGAGVAARGVVLHPRHAPRLLVLLHLRHLLRRLRLLERLLVAPRLALLLKHRLLALCDLLVGDRVAHRRLVVAARHLVVAPLRARGVLRGAHLCEVLGADAHLLRLAELALGDVVVEPRAASVLDVNLAGRRGRLEAVAGRLLLGCDPELVGEGVVVRRHRILKPHFAVLLRASLRHLVRRRRHWLLLLAAGLLLLFADRVLLGRRDDGVSKRRDALAERAEDAALLLRLLVPVRGRHRRRRILGLGLVGRRRGRRLRLRRGRGLGRGRGRRRLLLRRLSRLLCGVGLLKVARRGDLLCSLVRIQRRGGVGVVCLRRGGARGRQHQAEAEQAGRRRLRERERERER